MLVSIKQIREGGSVITLGKGKEPRRNYHFQPQDPKKPDEDHVCDVTNADDLATLLAIRDGYEVHPSALKTQAAKTAVAKVEKTEQQARAEAIAKARADAEAETQARLDAQQRVNQPPNPNAPAPIDYSKKTRPQLIKLVTDRTGRKPHASVAGSKLIAQLQALDAADANART